MVVQYQVELCNSPFTILGAKAGNKEHQHWMGIGFDNANFFGLQAGDGGPIYGQRTVSAKRLISPSGSSQVAGYREGRTEAVSHLPPYIIVNYEVIAG